MRFPNKMTAESFLAGHWQKKPLFFPAVVDAFMPALEAEEVAWLATLDDVESRLVWTRTELGQTTYHVEHGPFEAEKLAKLPQRDWSLLVQDVEKHLPDLRAFFDVVDFIPDWRIDDLMISVAAPGGSVGPHKDNYDVFLCQGSGVRNWALAPGQSCEVDATSDALALLKPFKGEIEYRATPGDMLYLPPGYAHWGVAEQLCMTCSIGMRAPNQAEMLAGTDRLYPGKKLQTGVLENDSTQWFYEDPDLSLSEARPGLISLAAAVRIQEQKLLPVTLSLSEIATVLGSVVTDPKAWISPENLDEAEARRWYSERSPAKPLQIHGMAQLAYTELADATLIFANGFCREMPKELSGLLCSICAHRSTIEVELKHMQPQSPFYDILLWLIQKGTVDIEA